MSKLKPSRNPPQPKRGWLHRQCAAEFDALEILRAKWEQMWRAKCEELAVLRKQAADLAAENVLQIDRARLAEAAFSDVREQLRQAQRDKARAEQNAAEHAVTIDGLGLAMAELERKADRRVIKTGECPNFDDPYQEARYEDGLGEQ